MTSIRKALGLGAAFLHNLWAQGPINADTAHRLWPAVQAAIIFVVFVGYQFFMGYGWTVPADPTNIHAWLMEFLNAATLGWAIVWPLVVSRIWPALVPYLLTLLDLMRAPRQLTAIEARADGTETILDMDNAVWLWKAA